MPFKYIIKWRRTQPEKVSVEAYHRYPHTEDEKHKPAFIIGKAEGGGILAIRHVLEKAIQKNLTKTRGTVTYILLDNNDESSYEMAYRIGLAAALIDKAQTAQEIEKGVKYVLNATPEEIWFWTSKLLDDEVNKKAVEALAVISGSTQINKTTESNTQITPQFTEPQKGTFWPMVRQRIQEKAIQLYKEDHPGRNGQPLMGELRKYGYLQKARSITLKEINMEKRAKGLKKHETSPTQNNHPLN